MSTDRLFELLRLRYWPGQMLRSRDLNHQAFFDSHLHAWHNRALHQTYGVVAGLAVTESGTEIRVAPGVAYDAYGYPLVLPARQVLSLPPGPDLLLVLRRRGESQQDGQNLREACLPAGIPQASGVELVWVNASHFNPRKEVGLARWDKNGQRVEDYRPVSVRALKRPHLAYGQSLADNTPWRLWLRDVPEAELSPQEFEALLAVHAAAGIPVEEPLPGVRILGIETEVDTSAAAFNCTPCYFAWLLGDLWDVSLPERLQQEEYATAFLLSFLEEDQAKVAAELIKREDFLSVWSGISRGEIAGSASRLSKLTREMTAASLGDVVADAIFSLPLDTSSKVLEPTETDESTRFYIVQVSVREFQPLPVTDFQKFVDAVLLLQMLQLRFGHIAQATAKSFTYRLWLPQLARWNRGYGLFELVLALARENQLHVGWLGLQQNEIAATAEDLGKEDQRYA